MKTGALSIVELSTAVVVLGVLAALAIPQFSQAGVTNAKADLKTDLAVLRTAIELYYRDHDAYPAQKDAGSEAARAGSPSAFIRQLALFTDADGHANPTRTTRFRFGPYLRDGIPACSVSIGGPSAKIHVIQGRIVPRFDCSVAAAGWIYNADTGYIAANSPGMNERGVRFDAY